ncbi:MAG: dihydrolipoyl dehydrogenase family protein [Candidatus Thorarchaeota archaeon]|jgi:dihydrolipoamide dehydrogenase
MKEYDLIIIGSGVGLRLLGKANDRGFRVAIIERGPSGGTCLNRGCIPTKILTYVADVIMEAEHLKELGVEVTIDKIDYPWIMQRMRERVESMSKGQEEWMASEENVDFYHGTGFFVDEYVIEVNGEILTAPNIIIASGSRPLIPNIKGLDKVEYLTNDGALHLMEKPKSMLIVGGGYVATEFGHFFSAVGTDVTIIGRNPYLVKNEDTDVSELLRDELSKRMNVHVNHEVVEVLERDGFKIVKAVNRETGEEIEFKGEFLLIAAGRRSNTDLLHPEKSGVKVDKNGWIIVDDYFRTSMESIWSLGDAINRYQFRHIANEENNVVWDNMMQTLDSKNTDSTPELKELSYHAVPRAVFSYPPIASVGLTLREAKKKGLNLEVAEVDYSWVAKGFAMGNPPSLFRLIIDGESRKIIGATIAGPHAPILIQEIINLMYTSEGTDKKLMEAVHIHPSLSELVQRSLFKLKPIEDSYD